MNTMTPEDFIKNEFKSKFIELCSARDFVRHFISFPNEVEKVGFHPNTQQADIKPISTIRLGRGDNERGLKEFSVDYNLNGHFYYFDPRYAGYDGDNLDIMLNYSGFLTDRNKILDDKVRIR
jgi:hypothetical protein